MHRCHHFDVHKDPKWLYGDIVTGITVAIVNIPQALSYASVGKRDTRIYFPVTHERVVACRFTSTVRLVLLVHRNDRLPCTSHDGSCWSEPLPLLAPWNLQRHYVRSNCGGVLVSGGGPLQHSSELPWRLDKPSNLGHPRVLVCTPRLENPPFPVAKSVFLPRVL